MKPVSRPVPSRRLLAVVLCSASVGLAACAGETEPPPPPAPVVGTIAAVPVEGGVELSLSELSRPVRSLQVDVALAGANALVAYALQGSDVVEAGLDAPRSDITVVVADTRRIPLTPGAVVRLETDQAPSAVTLTRALVVDDTGARGALQVAAP